MGLCRPALPGPDPGWSHCGVGASVAGGGNLDVSQALMGDTAVQSQVFDQCLVGLRTPVSGLPARKRTRLVTNWGGLHQCFSQRCTPQPHLASRF